MLVSVHRMWQTQRSTIGALAIDGKFFCYTLEPPADKRIAAGKYTAVKTISPKFTQRFKFNFYVPLLQNVPDHTAVEMHIGNTPEDTTDCTLLGMTHSVDFIGNSDDAFFAFMAATPNEFDVEYIDPEQQGETQNENQA